MGSNMLLCTLLVKYNGLLGPSGLVHLTKIVKQAVRPNVETDVLPVLRKQGRRQLQMGVEAAEGDSGFLVALTIHNVKILVAEEFALECCDTVLTDLLCMLHRPICLFLHLAIG